MIGRRLVSRPVPERSGRPIVGVDLGGGRAWSAATAVWKSGRVEVLAVAPGIPPLEQQEKRDRAPAGAYRKLAESGRLQVAEGLRVQPPAALWESIRARWGQPALVASELSDRLETPVELNFDQLYMHDLAGRAASFVKLVSGGMSIERAAALSGLMGMGEE